MIAMRVMQMSFYKVVDMVTVRYSFVSTARAMGVTWAFGSGGALHWVRRADREDMFVNMIPVHVVQMTVMNIVNVAIMTDRRMAAGRSVLMGMVGMVLLGTGGHRFLFLVFVIKRKIRGHLLSAACPNALCTSWRTWSSAMA
jgi:hypothetical protein